MRYRGSRGEELRNLSDALETTRDVQAYGRRHVGQVYRVKRLLRSAGVPVPRPRVSRADER